MCFACKSRDTASKKRVLLQSKECAQAWGAGVDVSLRGRYLLGNGWVKGQLGKQVQQDHRIFYISSSQMHVSIRKTVVSETGRLLRGLVFPNPVTTVW